MYRFIMYFTIFQKKREGKKTYSYQIQLLMKKKLQKKKKSQGR